MIVKLFFFFKSDVNISGRKAMRGAGVRVSNGRVTKQMLDEWVKNSSSSLRMGHS